MKSCYQMLVANVLKTQYSLCPNICSGVDQNTEAQLCMYKGGGRRWQGEKASETLEA